MKRWISFVLHLAMIVILTSFGSYTATKHVDYQIPDSLKAVTNDEAFVLPYAEVTEGALVNPPYLGNAYNGFKEALAFKESQGRYNVVNTIWLPRKIPIWIGYSKSYGRI